MSTAAIPPLPAGYQLDNAGEVPPLPKGYTLDSQAAQPAENNRSLLDHLANDPNNIPLDSYAHATEHGLASVGKGAARFVNSLRHPIDTLNAMTDIGPKVMDFATGSHEYEGQNPIQSAADLAKNAYKHPLETSEWAGDQAGQIIAGMGTDVALAKASPVISDVAQAAAQKASRAADMVRDVTPKQVAQVAGGATGAGLGHGALSVPGAYYGAKSFGRVAEAVLGKDRANAPIFSRAPELSLDNITDALAQTIAADRARFTEMQAKGLGEIPATGAKPAAQSGEALATSPTSIGPEPPKGGKAAPKFSAADRAAAQSLLQDALQHGTGDVVDAAISKDNRGVNLHAKAQVEFYLKRGDVGGAEQALDTAAKQANPAWQPPQRQIVPSTNEIRARVQSQAASASKADQLDTRALQQEMAQDLQKHGWSAESEARREFIARNSNEFNKSGKSRGYVEGESVKYTKTPGVNVSGKSSPAPAAASDDLTDLLQKSLDEARQRQQGK